jgi:hypothetical protein
MNRYCTGLQHENARGHLSLPGGRIVVLLTIQRQQPTDGVTIGGSVTKTWSFANQIPKDRAQSSYFANLQGGKNLSIVRIDDSLD